MTPRATRAAMIMTITAQADRLTLKEKSDIKQKKITLKSNTTTIESNKMSLKAKRLIRKAETEIN